MAGKQFPLSIIIRAVNEATAEIRKVHAQVAKAGRKISDIGRDLTTHVTLPIVALGAASLKTFSDFEAGMSNISTLIDESTESLDDMGKEVLAIGRRTPVAIDDLTSALYDVRSAGIGAADAMDVLERSARLGVAGLGTTKQSVDLVTSAINAFGLEGEAAERVYDNIFKTVKNGKTTIEGLAQGFGAVAGTVAATGTEFDEYLASVAALTTTGLPAAQAHTQLRAVISGLTRDTAKSRKVFGALGAKDLPDLIDKAGGLVPALELISGELGANEAKILELVGSTEALNAVLGLTGAQNAAYVKTLEDMREGANAVDEAFEKQNKRSRARLQRTKNALVGAGVAIGRILTPVLEAVSGALETAADWFANLDDSTQTWILTIAGIAAAIGPALFVVGKLVAIVSGLRVVLFALIPAIKAVSAALLTNPIALIVAGIATAALLIYKYWDPIKEFFGDLWDGIVAIFEWALDVVLGIVDKVVDAAKKVIEVAGDVKDYLGGGSGESTSFNELVDMMKGQGMSQADAEAFARRRLGIEEVAAPATARSEARIKVDITGAPRGSRAEIDPGSDADVDLSLGFQMWGVSY